MKWSSLTKMFQGLGRTAKQYLFQEEKSKPPGEYRHKSNMAKKRHRRNKIAKLSRKINRRK